MFFQVGVGVGFGLRFVVGSEVRNIDRMGVSGYQRWGRRGGFA